MKKNLKIIRSWKNAEYRSSLTDSQREMIPSHPSGDALLGVDMELIKGGVDYTIVCTYGCPTW